MPKSVVGMPKSVAGMPKTVVGMPKSVVRMPKPVVGRRYRGESEPQWQAAMEVANKLKGMIEVDGGGKPEAIEDKGVTVVRLRDMMQHPDRKNFDNTRIWVVGEDQSEDQRPMEIKIAEEKEATRKWQEPYERKLTLDELVKEDAEQSG